MRTVPNTALLWLAALVAVLIFSMPASAQNVSYALAIGDQAATVGENGFKQFDITVTNVSTRNLHIVIVRTVDERPDSLWQVAICYAGQACFADTLDTPPPIDLAPGDSAALDIAFDAAGAPGHARSVLQFSINGLREMVEKTFDVTKVTASINDTRGDQAVIGVHPNPSSGITTVVLPPFSGDASVEVFDALGRRLSDLSSTARSAVQSGSQSVRLDLSGCSSGTYLLRMAMGNVARSATVVVTH